MQLIDKVNAKQQFDIGGIYEQITFPYGTGIGTNYRLFTPDQSIEDFAEFGHTGPVPAGQYYTGAAHAHDPPCINTDRNQCAEAEIDQKMNRSRKTNRGLPRRVYIKDGSYRFFAPKKIRDPKDGVLKNWITLARVSAGEAAMYDALAKLLGEKQLDQESMPHLCAEFKANKLGRYGKDTQSQYKSYLDNVAKAFEEYRVDQVATKDFADFLKGNFKDKPNTAQKYTALAGKLFKYAISELGLRKDNPIDQLDKSDYETTRREFLPTHAQIAAIRKAGQTSKPRKDTGHTFDTLSGPMFCCIIDLTYLCWARAIDVRMLKESQIDEDTGYIRIKASKTKRSSGLAVDILITPAIQVVITRARAIKKKYEVISPFLLCTSRGKAYSKSGLTSMWERARERAGEMEVQFKDLRALGATDAAKTGNSKDEIRARLVHTDYKTSEIYIKETVPEKSSLNAKLPW